MLPSIYRSNLKQVALRSTLQGQCVGNSLSFTFLKLNLTDVKFVSGMIHIHCKVIEGIVAFDKNGIAVARKNN